MTISGKQKNGEYYDNILSSNKVESDGSVTRTWSSTAKTLSDLQTIKILSAKESAKSQLDPTDWYVVRKSEVGTAFSDEISAYRTAVRTCYGNLKTAINAASDIDELAETVYETKLGASQDTKTIDPSSAVNTTSNTITSNGHGFVDDEMVYYDAGITDDKNNTPIGGLSNIKNYYVFGKTTNTFKLSESHSSCGDETQ